MKGVGEGLVVTGKWGLGGDQVGRWLVEGGNPGARGWHHGTAGDHILWE